MRSRECVGAHHEQAERCAGARGEQQQTTTQAIYETGGHVGADNLDGGQHNCGSVWIDAGGARVAKYGGRVVDEGETAAELIDRAQADADEEAVTSGRSAWVGEMWVGGKSWLGVRVFFQFI